MTRSIGFLLLLLASTPARADTQADTAAAMRDLFDKGTDAYERRSYDEAFAHFMDAYDLRPSASLLYNAAVCREKMSDPDGAAALFRWYLEARPDASDREAVTERIAALDAASR